MHKKKKKNDHDVKRQCFILSMDGWSRATRVSRSGDEIRLGSQAGEVGQRNQKVILIHSDGLDQCHVFLLFLMLT